jgi:hypothetical protein
MLNEFAKYINKVNVSLYSLLQLDDQLHKQVIMGLWVIVILGQKQNL